MKEALIVQEICRGALDVKKVYKVRRINGSGKNARVARVNARTIRKQTYEGLWAVVKIQKLA